MVVAAAVLVLKPSSREKITPTFKASTAVDLKPGPTQVRAVAFSNDFPADTQSHVLSTLGAYVEKGVVAPLRTAKAVDTDLATIFDAGAKARLVGVERGIVLDEGLPKAIGKIGVTTPPVPLTALNDASGKVVLVSADVRFAITARTAKGTVTINRNGSLVFAPDPSGAWKITGWTLSTDRGGPGVTPAAASSEPTTTTVAR